MQGHGLRPATLEAPAQPSTAQLPSFGFSLLPVVLPLVLISISTLLTTFGLKDGVAAVFHFLGNPVIALLVGMLCGIWLLACNGGQRGDFSAVLEEAISKAGPVLIITGAGGMFGAIIKETGVGGALGEALVRLCRPAGALHHCRVAETCTRLLYGGLHHHRRHHRAQPAHIRSGFRGRPHLCRAGHWC